MAKRKDVRANTRQAAGRNTSARKKQAAEHGGPCPIMRRCGGCEWLGLPYRKQLARKHAAMVELYAPLIERFGWDVEVSPVMGMDSRSPRAFRHKAATPFAPGEGGEVRGGFFARGTHDIVACPACAVEAPGARELLNEVATVASELGIPAYDEDRRCGQLRYAVLRCGWRTGERMLTLVTRSREAPVSMSSPRACATPIPSSCAWRTTSTRV